MMAVPYSGRLQATFPFCWRLVPLGILATLGMSVVQGMLNTLSDELVLSLHSFSPAEVVASGYIRYPRFTGGFRYFSYPQVGVGMLAAQLSTYSKKCRP